MDQIDKPKISVVIPSLNQAQWLGGALQSIARQSYDNCEVIIIDGGSQDNTSEIARQYSDIVTTFISESDDGQSHAVNKGVALAKGDFLIWQNADDIFLDDAFTDFVELFRSQPEYDVYYGNMMLIDAEEKAIGNRFYCAIDRIIARYGGLICNNQSAFIRRSLLNGSDLLDTDYHYAMDRELFLRLYYAGARFKYLDKCIAGFRAHSDSKSGQENNKRLWSAEHHRIAEKYNLYRPSSLMYRFMRVVATADKAVRMGIRSPRNFLGACEERLSQL